MLPFASHIVVVDDDEDTRDLYVVAFEATGFTVRTAATIAEARVLIREAKPDVLIADYSLPDGTGDALLELCADARPRLCILVTGFHQTQIAAGRFDFVLTKPVDFRKLVAVVKDVAAEAP